MQTGEQIFKEEIIKTGRRIHNLRLATAMGGNLSARIDKNNILITATSASLGELEDPS